MFKRFFLLFGVNIAIILMGSLVLNLLGVQGYMSDYGINYQSLAIFCLVFGFGGAFVNLQISRWMAKRIYGVQLIQAGGQYAELYQTVHMLAQKAKLPVMPEVGIYHSDDMNAFATGPSKSKSLVAVSTGLLRKMDRDQVEGVLAHEVSHIANGDMVTMTLLQGVMNAFVMFLARIVAHLIDNAMRSDDERGGGLGYFGYMATVFVMEMIFGLLASIIVSYFSRYREFRADAGAAKLSGKEKMISALEALKSTYENIGETEPAFQSMQISSKSSIVALLSTHPSLDRRIAALKGQY